VWQPNSAQWRIIWIVAVLLIFAWPPEKGRRLGMKLVNWAVDPSDALRTPPPPLPIGLDDDGDAVTAHDAETAEYYEQYQSSGLTRLRMRLKVAGDPFDPSTERQILVGFGVLSGLLVWRLGGARPRNQPGAP